MGPDSANLAASVAKSVEVDRSPSATQRASEIAQDRLAGESVAALLRKKPSAADQLQREKIRQERERKRREMERRAANPAGADETDTEDGSILDVMV
jgi:hypothetical protein